MARQYEESTAIRAGLNLMEDESPVSALIFFVTEYNLPAKVIAQCAGISVQTLYSYTNTEDGVRLTQQLEPKITRLVDRLKTLAAEGKLDISGSGFQRNMQLVDLLTVEEPAQ